MSTQVQEVPSDSGQMTLIEHLIELRSRIIKCALAVAIGAALGWIVYVPVLRFLTDPLRQLSNNSSQLFPGTGKLLATDPLEPFAIRIKVSAYLGIFLAMPVLLWQFWRFIAPGLYSNEKKYAMSFVASALALFAAGSAIAYWTLPKAIDFLSTVGGSDFVNGYSAQKYLMLILYMMLAFGGGFEFPIVLIFLQLAHVVTYQQLNGFRRWAYVLVAVLAAVITPSTDPISMCALMFPMWIFYEVAILFGYVRMRRQRRAAAKAAVT
ncbi:MAG: twin-arginine translocase subunit TatC [Solirubrobacteraceae bacterium]